MIGPSLRLGEVQLGLTTQGIGLALERGEFRLGIEHTWRGDTRAGLFYRATF